MKLYRIELKGLHGWNSSNTDFGRPFVLANDPTEADMKVQKYLVEHKLGFESDRQLATIELLAEDGDFPKTRAQLFL